MDVQKLKIANILLWSGAGLLILGIAISYPTFAPYFSTLFYTPKIPTAPPITVVMPTMAEPVILPFEGEPVSAVPSREATQEPPTAPAPSPSAVTPDVVPTNTPVWNGATPTRLRIPALGLESPVVPTGWETVEIDGVEQAVWDVPNWRAAGWHNTSAKLGVPGNTVLNGHNTTEGEIFRDLYTLEIGALILVEGDDGETYAYGVGEIYILPEAGQPLEVRIENARYIQTTEDERLTLVTCHPYGSLANRLLIIAYPAPEPELVPTEGE